MCKYELVMWWSEDDNAYLIEVPELPGCMADGATYEEALANVATILEGHRKDIPFALLYLLEPQGGIARLVAFTGVETAPEMAPPSSMRSGRSWILPGLFPHR